MSLFQSPTFCVHLRRSPGAALACNRTPSKAMAPSPQRPIATPKVIRHYGLHVCAVFCFMMLVVVPWSLHEVHSKRDSYSREVISVPSESGFNVADRLTSWPVSHPICDVHTLHVCNVRLFIVSYVCPGPGHSICWESDDAALQAS